MKLKNKRIVVTGGSRGLGRALVTCFAGQGARVAFCSRTWDDLNRVALNLSVEGIAPVIAACDVADPGQVDAFTSLVLSEFGSVDILVNNAAILGQRADIIDWTRASWERVIDVNVNGLFYVTKAFLPSMIRQRSGLIVNVTSSVGKVGRSRWGAYAVSKFAVEGLTQTLAEEMKGSGVTVLSLDPGRVDTDMRHAAYPEENRSKLPRPGDVADVIVHILSARALPISGSSVLAQEYVQSKKEIA